MYLIAGLGNPGSEYKWTRHNAGFEVISKLAYDYNIDMKVCKFKALTGDGRVAGVRARLVMPQTYMNLSGECIRDFMAFYDVSPERLIVVYDDTALPVGAIRVREQGSAGGQKGMKNIIWHLDTDVFPRVRVGIGTKPQGYSMSDYVLSRFTPDERDDIIKGITLAGDAVCDILKDGVSHTMTRYNKKLEIAGELGAELPES